jgi:hypothetical protein
MKKTNLVPLIFILITVLFATCGCNSPVTSQKYFANAALNDPLLEPIHQTPLYTVYYDSALMRCVLHSSYTWGEGGGGSGGTGIGVTIFNCDPRRLKAHVDLLREKQRNGQTYFPLPPSKNLKSPARRPAHRKLIPMRTPSSSKESTPVQPQSQTTPGLQSEQVKPVQPVYPQIQPIQPSGSAK